MLGGRAHCLLLQLLFPSRSADRMAVTSLSYLRPAKLQGVGILGATLIGAVASYAFSDRLLPGIMGDGPPSSPLLLQLLEGILVVPGYLIFYGLVLPIGGRIDEIWVAVLHPTELVTASNAIGYALVSFLCIEIWNYRAHRKVFR